MEDVKWRDRNFVLISQICSGMIAEMWLAVLFADVQRQEFIYGYKDNYIIRIFWLERDPQWSGPTLKCVAHTGIEPTNLDALSTWL